MVPPIFKVAAVSTVKVPPATSCVIVLLLKSNVPFTTFICATLFRFTETVVVADVLFIVKISMEIGEVLPLITDAPVPVKATSYPVALNVALLVKSFVMIKLVKAVIVPLPPIVKL